MDAAFGGSIFPRSYMAYVSISLHHFCRISLSPIPSFEQISLLAKDCRNALTIICKNIAEKLVQENVSLKESNGIGCFLTLNNEADRLCGWIATLNNADLLKEALKTVITQSRDTEMKTDDMIAATFAQHATLGLLLLAAYLEKLGQQFGLGRFCLASKC
jgi:hypothetical protein